MTSNADDPRFPGMPLPQDADDDFDRTKPYRFVVRLPAEMRDRLAEASVSHRRSINSEIVARLEQTFSGLPGEVESSRIEPPLQGPLDALFRRSLTEDEQTLVRMFRRLSQPKKQALIDLLK
jgi:hypothetical protein